MAVVTSVAIGAVGVGMSAYQAYSGSKQAEQARRDLENQPVQELKNSYRDLNVTRYGADLKQEAQQNVAASQVEALKGAGVRGVVGGLGRVEAGNQAVAQEIGADLDAQRKAIDQAIASGDMTVQQMEEQRKNANIAALSSQISAGQQQQWAGLQGMAQSASAAASGYSQLKGANATPAQRTQLTPQNNTLTAAPITNTPMSSSSAPMMPNYAIGQGFSSTPGTYSGFGSVPNVGQSLYNQQYVK
jgi:hypothetical protein